jgi:hypothetical protein
MFSSYIGYSPGTALFFGLPLRRFHGNQMQQYPVNYNWTEPG